MSRKCGFLTSALFSLFLFIPLAGSAFTDPRVSPEEDHFALHSMTNKEIGGELANQLEEAHDLWSRLLGYRFDELIDIYYYDRILSVEELKRSIGKHIVLDKYVPTLTDEVQLTDDVYYRDPDVQVAALFLANYRTYFDKIAASSTSPWHGGKERVEFRWWEKGLFSFLKGSTYTIPSYREFYVKGRLSSMDSSMRGRLLRDEQLSGDFELPANHISANAISEAFWYYLYSNTGKDDFADIVDSVTRKKKSLGEALKEASGEDLDAVWKRFVASFPARGEKPVKAEKYLEAFKFDQIMDFSISPTGKYIAIIEKNVPERETLSIRETDTRIFKFGLHHRKYFGYAWSADETRIYYQFKSAKDLRKSFLYDIDKKKTEKKKELSLLQDFTMGFGDVTVGIDESMNMCVLQATQRNITCFTEKKPYSLKFLSPRQSPLQAVFSFTTVQNGKLTNYVMDPKTEKHSEIFSELDLVVNPSWTPTGQCLYFMGHKDGRMDLYRFCLDSMQVERSDTYFGDVDFPHTNPEDTWLYFVRHEPDKDTIERYPLGDVTWKTVTGRSRQVPQLYSFGPSSYSEPPKVKDELKWFSPYAVYPYFSPVPYGVSAGVGFDTFFKPLGNLRGHAAWDSKVNNADLGLEMERDRLLWQPRFKYALTNTYVRATDSFRKSHFVDFAISFRPHPNTRLSFGARIEYIFFKNLALNSDSFSGPYVSFDITTKPNYFSLTPLPGFRWKSDAYVALDWNGNEHHPVVTSDLTYTLAPGGFIYDIGAHLAYTSHVNPSYQFFTFGGDLGYLPQRTYPGVTGLPYQQFTGQKTLSINQELWFPPIAVKRGISDTYLFLDNIYFVGLLDIGWPDFMQGGNHYSGAGIEMRLTTKITPYLPLRLAGGFHRSFSGFGNTIYWGVRSQF